MPHINRIRVNNVKYNFGTQSYEDFLLKPFGHNMLYDLANGGGKSVLMLLMLQNVLPNCSLDDKQPVEKLFRTGDGSQTIHSLIEWKLDDCDVMDGFRYMTTGFCARKAQNIEEREDTASIEYFNYCIFYREYNENDIRNLPLVKNQEKITYSGLRKYLKELERDNSLIVRVFDRKGEYQSFIADYGLYESEWEIIRGINKTEGHVRTYFETNYRTTRKVVEDLLIEEIIQKSFRLRGGMESEDGMSKTLLDMKDKLLELSKKKSQIGEFDSQIELLTMFADRVDSLREMYARIKERRKEIGSMYQLAGNLAAEYAGREEEIAKDIVHQEKQITLLHEKIDAARYSEDRSKVRQLEQEMKKLSKEVEEDTASLDKRTRELIRKESMNDYLEYLEEKARRDETMAELGSMQTGKGALLTELQFLAHHMEREIERREREMQAERTNLQTRISSLLLREKSVDEKERECSKDIAVAQTKMEEYESTIRSCDAQIAMKKREAGLLLTEDCERVLGEVRQQISASGDKTEKLKAELERKQEELAQLDKNLLKAEYEKQKLTEETDFSAAFFAEYQEQKQRADKLLAVYGVKEYDKLRRELKNRAAKGEETLAEVAAEIAEMTRWQKAVTEEPWGGFLPEPKKAEQIKEYLKSRYQVHGMTGREYLKRLPEDMRRQYLVDYPFLPYAMVVDQMTDAMLSDEKLRDEKDGRLLPFIKEAALRNHRDLLIKGDLHIVSEEFASLCEEDILNRELSRVISRLSELTYRERRLKDQQQTYEEDGTFLDAFYYGYEKQYQESRNRQREREKKLALLTEQWEADKQKKVALGEEMERLTLEAAREKRHREALEGNEAVLMELSEEIRKNEELNSVCDRKKALVEQLSLKKKELIHTISELKREKEEVTKRLDVLTRETEQFVTEWKKKIQPYQKEGNYEPCLLAKDALIAEFNGKRMAYEKEHSQSDDKNRLLQSYVSAMNRCLKSITGRGISVSLMKEYEDRGELFSTPETVLVSLREENANAGLSLSAKKQKLDKITADWNRFHGKTSQFATELSEKYGSAMELSIPEDEIEEYIESNRSQMNRLQAALAALKENQKSCQSEAVLFEDMKKDIERMARNDRTILVASENPVQEELSAAELKERFYLAEAEYDKNLHELEKRREDFLRNRQKVMDTLRELNAMQLAQEIQENIQMPNDEDETARMVKNLQDVSECLMLEKSRIESGLSDMIVLKDNFENQCLQRCLNIKAELDRLSKLSKITLGKEQISMISLQIPYVKEEYFKERMSDYIDTIVANVEAYREQSDRLKYIRTALSFKKLFSVIVTDMNDIRLSLYKRERIKEQSRLLRYEEAVGSTGQSQGIYIQFLIAIINYITCINSGKNDNQKLGKVIFIDNPFGAAKDIYIWEPIFELLRTNHVQLIVPARGTTPAITGRFDVNYILGQKLVGGKQQTVVVDYRSSITTDAAEYIPLQYEQESFDFI